MMPHNRNVVQAVDSRDPPRSGLTGLALELCVALTVLVAGCGEPAPPAGAPPQMVYVDLATKAPFVAAQSEQVPAVHPQTGRRTLMPGLYCPKCAQWRPAPPLEELQRNPQARTCPKCRGPMTAEGPWPGER